MKTFIVLCRFRPNTDMTAVAPLLPAERAQVDVLRAEGRLGALFVSLERGTVFLEVRAADAAGAEEAARTLPLARFWDLDTFPIAGGPPPAT